MLTSTTNLPRLISPWNDITFPKLVESTARSRGDDIAYIDAPDTRSWLYRPARALTYRLLAQEVTKFACQLATLGLKRGDALMMVLPNAVEFPIACLGAMMAGIVPVPVSLGLAPERIRQIAELTNAQAIVTVSKLAEISPAMMMRDIAAQVFSIRAVASFGADVPDGVVALDEWDEADLNGLEPASALGRDDISLISVEFADEVPRALARTQSQLIAEAVALSSTAHIGAKWRIVNTIVPGSAFSVISSVALPILVRAQLHFHGVFASETLIQQIKSSPGIALIAPQAVEPGIVELAEKLQGSLGARVLLHRLEHGTRVTPPDPALDGRVVDVTALGEAGHFVIPRPAPGKIGPLPQNWRQPGTRVVESDMLLLKARIGTDSRITLSGFGAANPLGTAAGSSMEGGILTEILAHSGEGQTFVPFEEAELLEASDEANRSAA